MEVKDDQGSTSDRHKRRQTDRQTDRQRHHKQQQAQNIDTHAHMYTLSVLCLDAWQRYSTFGEDDFLVPNDPQFIAYLCTSATVTGRRRSGDAENSDTAAAAAAAAAAM